MERIRGLGLAVDAPKPAVGTGGSHFASVLTRVCADPPSKAPAPVALALPRRPPLVPTGAVPPPSEPVAGSLSAAGPNPPALIGPSPEQSDDASDEASTRDPQPTDLLDLGPAPAAWGWYPSVPPIDSNPPSAWSESSAFETEPAARRPMATGPREVRVEQTAPARDTAWVVEGAPSMRENLPPPGLSAEPGVSHSNAARVDAALVHWVAARRGPSETAPPPVLGAAARHASATAVNEPRGRSRVLAVSAAPVHGTSRSTAQPRHSLPEPAEPSASADRHLGSGPVPQDRSPEHPSRAAPAPWARPLAPAVDADPVHKLRGRSRARASEAAPVQGTWRSTAQPRPSQPEPTEASASADRHLRAAPIRRDRSSGMRPTHAAPVPWARPLAPAVDAAHELRGRSRALASDGGPAEPAVDAAPPPERRSLSRALAPGPADRHLSAAPASAQGTSPWTARLGATAPAPPPALDAVDWHASVDAPPLAVAPALPATQLGADPRDAAPPRPDRAAEPEPARPSGSAGRHLSTAVAAETQSRPSRVHSSEGPGRWAFDGSAPSSSFAPGHAASALSSDDEPGQRRNQEAPQPVTLEFAPGSHIPSVGSTQLSDTQGKVVPARAADVSASAPELHAGLAEPPAPPIPSLLQLNVADPLGDWTLDIHRDGHNLNLLFSGHSSLADVVTGAGQELEALVKTHGQSLGSVEFREAAQGATAQHHGSASGSAGDASGHGFAGQGGSDRQTNKPPVPPPPPSDARSPAAGRGSRLNRLA